VKFTSIRLWQSSVAFGHTLSTQAHKLGPLFKLMETSWLLQRVGSAGGVMDQEERRGNQPGSSVYERAASSIVIELAEAFPHRGNLLSVKCNMRLCIFCLSAAESCSRRHQQGRCLLRREDFLAFAGGVETNCWRHKIRNRSSVSRSAPPQSAQSISSSAVK
jgi:hypothetical protein